jgi:DNA/RNA endonuclease G (NUC1)
MLTQSLHFFIQSHQSDNEDLSGRHYSEFLVSIDAVEAVTGLDFLSSLPTDVQQQLGSTVSQHAW